MSDDNPADGPTETFHATGGRATGLLGLVIATVMVVAGLAAHPTSWLTAAAGLLVGVVSWVVLLRPLVLVSGNRLVLRGMVSTVRLPLASVSEVMVRQMLVVGAGDERFTSAAVGRNRRSLRKQDNPRSPGRTGRSGIAGMVGMGRLGEGFESEFGEVAPRAVDNRAYGLIVEERIRHLVEQAKAQGEQPGPAEREPARPEIAALVVSLVLLAAAVLVAAL